MMYQSYENLEVWKKSVDVSTLIYKILQECRDYGFKDQICRASVSVASNIAEGMERDSKKETATVQRTFTRAQRKTMATTGEKRKFKKIRKP